MSGPRSSSRTSTTLAMDAYLVFDAKGNLRMTRLPGTLKAGERQMAITITVPMSLFRTPELRGTITIADDGSRDRIVADVETNAAKVLREAMGVDLKLRIVQQE